MSILRPLGISSKDESFFILMFFTKKQPQQQQEDFKKDKYRWCLEQKKKYEKKNKI